MCPLCRCQFGVSCSQSMTDSQTCRRSDIQGAIPVASLQCTVVQRRQTGIPGNELVDGDFVRAGCVLATVNVTRYDADVVRFRLISESRYFGILDVIRTIRSRPIRKGQSDDRRYASCGSRKGRCGCCISRRCECVQGSCRRVASVRTDAPDRFNTVRHIQ